VLDDPLGFVATHPGLYVRSGFVLRRTRADAVAAVAFRL
jgi:hypothetical protein